MSRTYRNINRMKIVSCDCFEEREHKIVYNGYECAPYLSSHPCGGRYNIYTKKGTYCYNGIDDCPHCGKKIEVEYETKI